MFEIKNVSKKYGSEYAIKNLNLQIGKGLNFIIGASGSGKTTLLKMISGMDNQFEGEILYLGQSIKNLNDSQKAYYYNNKFGFVYQDFNLIEDMTVEENIMLPLYIKNVSVKYEIEKVLRKLNISKLRNTKVKLLSGGQKQRVAIARELVKNPQVIIADEPTSALDPKTALEVINILKDISKERMVIIVTHDTSLIDKKSKVYELDKGELISKPEDIESQAVVSKINSQKKFKLSNAFEVGIINNKSKLARSFVTCLSMLVSTVLLMTSVSGSVSKGGEESFNKLFEDYGKSILDISIVKSFTGGASTGEDGNENPNVDVTQDISGIYDKYIEDERVDYILFVKAFNNIDISVDGKEYKIESSGTVPSLNNILVGDVPKNKGEVLVPESFIKKLGLSNEKAIGKEIDFSGSIYNWDSGEPEIANVNTKAKIVGIADSKMKSVFEGNTYEFELEDAFFFDKDTLSEINKQAGIKANNHDLQMRVKTPQDLIAIKDALNAKGIVPIGQFELVEDIVRLDSQTNNLSKGSSLIIGCLAICAVIAIALVSANMRKREYAIYKVCGYSKSQLSLVLFAESSIATLISATSLVILSPVISILTKTAFGTSITNINTLVIGVVITVGTSCICYFITSIIGKSTDPLIVLKSGGR